MQDPRDYAHVYALLFDLATRLQVLMDRELRPDDLTAKQWYLVLSLERSGEDSLALGELARLVGTSHQNVKQIALKLERRGFVTLRSDPGDRRSVRVSVTDACRRYFESRSARDAELLSLLFAPVDEQVPHLRSTLEALDKHLDSLL